MRHLLHGTACALLVGASVVAASADQGRGRSGGDPPREVVHQSHGHATTSVHFEIEHVRVIKAHYAPQVRQLPPGLQKKYARTGQLPPGWQKKMEPLPVAIERNLPPLPTGYRRGVIDGHAVIYSSKSGTIIDVAVLF
jgi:hypothetical protein